MPLGNIIGMFNSEEPGREWGKDKRHRCEHRAGLGVLTTLPSTLHWGEKKNNPRQHSIPKLTT